MNHTRLTYLLTALLIGLGVLVACTDPTPSTRSTAPTPPSNLEVTVSPGQAALNWTDNSDKNRLRRLPRGRPKRER